MITKLHNNDNNPEKMIWLASHFPKANAIFVFLQHYRNGLDAVICSNVIFQRELHMSRQSVINSIKVLENEKFIIVKKTGKSNIFILNSDCLINQNSIKILTAKIFLFEE